MLEELLQYIVYGAAGILAFLLRTLWTKMDSIRTSVERLRLELTKRELENKELFHNIQRLDKNIDDLFDKIDCVLSDYKCNTKK